MSDPYKQIIVQDFSNPDRKAVFTMETPGDLLVKVELQGGISVRMEPGTLEVIGKTMQDGEEQRQQAGN
jgi:hypothetical protein